MFYSIESSECLRSGLTDGISLFFKCKLHNASLINTKLCKDFQEHAKIAIDFLNLDFVILNAFMHISCSNEYYLAFFALL